MGLLRLIANDHEEPHRCESLETFSEKGVDSFALPQYSRGVPVHMCVDPW